MFCLGSGKNTSVRQILPTVERESESEGLYQLYFHINIVFPFCQAFRSKTFKLS